eukprot:jgi/Hompol1/2360/HPOL_002954-RA
MAATTPFVNPELPSPVSSRSGMPSLDMLLNEEDVDISQHAVYCPGITASSANEDNRHHSAVASIPEPTNQIIASPAPHSPPPSLALQPFGSHNGFNDTASPPATDSDHGSDHGSGSGSCSDNGHGYAHDGSFDHDAAVAVHKNGAEHGISDKPASKRALHQPPTLITFLQPNKHRRTFAPTSHPNLQVARSEEYKRELEFVKGRHAN